MQDDTINILLQLSHFPFPTPDFFLAVLFLHYQIL